MNTDKELYRTRVRYSDGSTFEVEVRTVSDYLLTTTFLHFYLICIAIYAVTIWPGNNLNLNTVGSIIVWSAVLVSAFIVLLIGVWLNFMLVRKGILTYIYTAVILIPVVMISTFLGGNISQIFGSSFHNHADVFFKIALPNMLLAICFDILHGRYVAPQHPSYIHPNKSKATAPQTASKPQSEPQMAAPTDEPAAKDVAPVPQPMSPQHEHNEVSLADPKPEQPAIAKISKIEFGKEGFVASDILWIQSESHYLRVQMSEKSFMVRAKLRAAVEGLSDEIGIQINRSVWVAFSAVKICHEDPSGYLELQLTDQSTHRVSRARQLVFKLKFDDFKKSKPKNGA